ncbi:MAG: orotidine-5'-phosphate decarboxylase [Candidatus Cloacimonetes bacterium]|nr:orotidine-5'-phosphate decarboxylase [Candidatus Cloacimonadota bacterium]
MNFIEKYEAISLKNYSFVCVGLDSEYERIPEFLKTHYKDPIFQFNKKIINATQDMVAAYKPNLAFYLAQGERGISALQRTINYIPDEIPVILDCKAGDIGNTMRQYAQAAFDKLKVDAITANPLMGKNVVDVFDNYSEKYIFLLVLTSNPSSADFLNNESQLYTKVCEKIKEWNKKNLGAVVGATKGEEIGEIRRLLPNNIFLLPGLGAQGGNISQVMENATAKSHPRIIVNSSRSIIFASEEEDFARKAAKATEDLRKRINHFLK